METRLSIHAILDALPNLSESEIIEINSASAALAEEHKIKRQKEALATIRRLAKENGLDLEIKRASRKRGRPVRPDRAAG